MSTNPFKKVSPDLINPPHKKIPPVAIQPPIAQLPNPFLEMIEKLQEQIDGLKQRLKQLLLGGKIGLPEPPKLPVQPTELQGVNTYHFGTGLRDPKPDYVDIPEDGWSSPPVGLEIDGTRVDIKPGRGGGLRARGFDLPRGPRTGWREDGTELKDDPTVMKGIIHHEDGSQSAVKINVVEGPW